ncbi:hypothetical protein J416_06737 [Gracilibacillus halophilus YIM-C55.5]|uniref:Hydrolase n=1 Tax=Gracilibacillus halophilus YIM-C55.5 TaxID=1308866 RepID=N4WRW5_9BACI|nr:hypothetical protein [Gracilibacillus halophilus]ENH97125.1 hypothetical protein J416_06737 [Gracilibacillus halophilus YIM-C55.5]
MEKKKYYVNLGTQEISQMVYGNNNDFTIYATGEEVFLLREKFNDIHDADMRSYVRSHIPFTPYHNDPQNDDYDTGMTEVIQMIYQLGDEKTKKDINEMGILEK